jgi:hypothetical protein
MLQERNVDPGTFDPTGHGGPQGQHNTADPFGRVGMNLPPSGPMAMSAGWYNRSSAGVPPSTLADPNGRDLASHGPVCDDPTAPTTGLTTGGAINPSGPDGHPGMDPLSSMDPLRQALPDVGGVATPAVVGDI